MFFTKLPRGSLIFACLSLPTFKKYLEIWVKDMFDCKDKLLEIHEDFHPEKFPSTKIFIHKDFHPQRFPSTKISIHKDFYPQRFPSRKISIQKHHKLWVTELLKQALSEEIKNTLINMFIQKKSVSFCYINSLESVLSVLGWT